MKGDKYHLFKLPMGWMVLLGGQRGLKRASLKPSPQEGLEDLGRALDDAKEDTGVFDDIINRLNRYSAGEMAALDEIELDLTGVPPFFSAAWKACRTIPPGETRSYAWLAAQAGSPLAMRAAGQSMARNRFSLIIPCHRVIASDGGLGGYGGGGLGVKARLLQMELEQQSSRWGQA